MSAEQEMDAVREWKEGLGPEDVVLWEVRWRGSHEPVPAEETDAGDFAKLKLCSKRSGLQPGAGPGSHNPPRHSTRWPRVPNRRQSRLNWVSE